MEVKTGRANSALSAKLSIELTVVESSAVATTSPCRFVNWTVTVPVLAGIAANPGDVPRPVAVRHPDPHRTVPTISISTRRHSRTAEPNRSPDRHTPGYRPPAPAGPPDQAIAADVFRRVITRRRRAGRGVDRPNHDQHMTKIMPPREVSRVHRRRRERRAALLTSPQARPRARLSTGRAGPPDMMMPPTRSSRTETSSPHQSRHLPADRIDHGNSPSLLTLEPQPVIVVGGVEGRGIYAARSGSLPLKIFFPTF